MKKVALVDDEETVIECLTQLLQRHGYDVSSTTKGDEAMALMERCNEFDVIVSDIVMPNMNGIDLLKKARSICPVVPFVMISGYPSFDVVEEAFKQGAYSYIAKPIDNNNFLHLLDRACEKKALEEENIRYRESLEAQVKERTEAFQIFHHCFDQSNDAMVILNESRQMLDVNKAFENVTGYKKDEVVGKTMSVLRSDYFDRSFYVEMWESAVKKGSWVGDVVNRKKDGTVYQTRFSLGAIKDCEGKNTYYLGTFVDIEFD